MAAVESATPESMLVQRCSRLDCLSHSCRSIYGRRAPLTYAVLPLLQELKLSSTATLQWRATSCGCVEATIATLISLSYRRGGRGEEASKPLTRSLTISGLDNLVPDKNKFSVSP